MQCTASNWLFRKILNNSNKILKLFAIIMWNNGHYVSFIKLSNLWYLKSLLIKYLPDILKKFLIEERLTFGINKSKKEAC